MIAGRPGTSTEGMVFLLYESESGAKLARFNLQWLLSGTDFKNFLKL
jgi:sialidase-1